MIRAWLARILFALAAASALAAGMGVAVPAHQEEAGAPPFHDHVLGAYRYGFLLPPPEVEASPAMATLHQTLRQAGVPLDVIWQMPGMALRQQQSALPTIKSAGLSPIQDLAIELALLVLLVPRLPRPTLRTVAEIKPPHVPAPLWRLAPPLLPPRPAVLP